MKTLVGPLIMTILRLITPEETAEIATKHNGGKFVPLTDLLKDKLTPLKTVNQIVQNAEKIPPIQEDVSADVIVLEKERIKRNQAKLKAQEVYDLYRKNEKLDLVQVRKHNTEDVSVVQNGVLINKKQN